MTHGMKFVSILGSQLILWGGGSSAKFGQLLKTKLCPPFGMFKKIQSPSRAHKIIIQLRELIFYIAKFNCS